MRSLACLFLTFCSCAYAEPLDVLFIGDSITCSTQPEYIGYSYHIADTHPDWDVTRSAIKNTENALALYASNPSLYAGHDVIYFNTGLHSIRLDTFEDLETYAANLAQYTDLLLSTGATVIWRTTTPIAEGASGDRDYTLVPVYNAAALEVMQQRPVFVDDVYDFLLPYYNADPSKGGANLLVDGTHWNTDRQSSLIAPHVAESISTLSSVSGDSDSDGDVDMVDLMAIQSGGTAQNLLKWKADFGTGSTPPIPFGDTDGDYDVDVTDLMAVQRNGAAPDLVNWKAHFGTGYVPNLRSGDVDGDNDVDVADLMMIQRGYPDPGVSIWRDYFGLTDMAAAASGATIIPEPTAALLSTVAALWGIASKRQTSP